MKKTRVLTPSLLIACLFLAFQIYTALFGLLPGLYQRAIHWCFAALFGCALNLENAKNKTGAKKILSVITDSVLALLIALGTGYLCFNYEAIVFRLGNVNRTDLLCCLAIVISTIVISYRTKNKILVAITGVCVLYCMSFVFMPNTKMTLERILSMLCFGTDGMYGTALGVCTNYIYLFVLLGALIDYSGAGRFFVRVSGKLTRRFRTGSAMTALLAGGFLGMLSGSGVANAVTVGSLCVPLMKESGYSAKDAAAIHSIGTNVAQLMPPVLGGVVFLAIDTTGKGYTVLMRASLAAALTYFVISTFTVWLFSNKKQLVIVSREEEKTGSNGPLEAILYVFPFAWMLFLMIARGASAVKGGIVAVLSMAAVGIFRKVREKDFHGRDLLQVAQKVAKTLLNVATTCTMAGIIIGALTVTNVGSKLTQMILTASGNNLLIGYFLMMLVTLVLGMVLPSSAVYVLIAALGVPALVEMGAQPLAAHMFIIYYAVLAPMTPPVALSTAAMSALTGESFMDVCIASMKLAIPLLPVPFVFVYQTDMLLQSGIGAAALPFCAALLSGACIAVATQGWLRKGLNSVCRILFAAVGIALVILPNLW